MSSIWAALINLSQTHPELIDKVIMDHIPKVNIDATLKSLTRVNRCTRELANQKFKKIVFSIEDPLPYADLLAVFPNITHLALDCKRPASFVPHVLTMFFQQLVACSSQMLNKVECLTVMVSGGRRHTAFSDCLRSLLGRCNNLRSLTIQDGGCTYKFSGRGCNSNEQLENMQAQISDFIRSTGAFSHASSPLHSCLTDIILDRMDNDPAFSEVATAAVSTPSLSGLKLIGVAKPDIIAVGNCSVLPKMTNLSVTIDNIWDQECNQSLQRAVSKMPALQQIEVFMHSPNKPVLDIDALATSPSLLSAHFAGYTITSSRLTSALQHVKRLSLTGCSGVTSVTDLLPLLHLTCLEGSALIGLAEVQDRDQDQLDEQQQQQQQQQQGTPGRQLLQPPMVLQQDHPWKEGLKELKWSSTDPGLQCLLPQLRGVVKLDLEGPVTPELCTSLHHLPGLQRLSLTETATSPLVGPKPPPLHRRPHLPALAHLDVQSITALHMMAHWTHAPPSVQVHVSDTSRAKALDFTDFSPGWADGTLQSDLSNVSNIHLFLFTDKAINSLADAADRLHAAGRSCPSISWPVLVGRHVSTKGFARLAAARQLAALRMLEVSEHLQVTPSDSWGGPLELTPEYIHELSNLRNAVVVSEAETVGLLVGATWTDATVGTCCRVFPKAKKLLFQGLSGITSAALWSIVVRCPQLEVLSIDDAQLHGLRMDDVCLLLESATKLEALELSYHGRANVFEMLGYILGGPAAARFGLEGWEVYSQVGELRVSRKRPAGRVAGLHASV